MPLTEKVSARLILKDVPPGVCWGKPEDFIKLLTSALGVELAVSRLTDFVIIGHQTPTADDKGRLWIRLSKAGLFQGFFLFQRGKWRRIHNYRNDEIIWMVGDSRDIPDGFELINGTVAGIPTDVQNFILTKYLANSAASTPTQTVYSYFAVRYTGF